MGRGKRKGLNNVRVRKPRVEKHIRKSTQILELELLADYLKECERSKNGKRREELRPCVECQQLPGKIFDDAKLTLLENGLTQHQNSPSVSKYLLNENKTKLTKAHTTQTREFSRLSEAAQFYI